MEALTDTKITEINIDNTSEVKYRLNMRLENLDSTGRIAAVNELRSSYRLTPGKAISKAVLEASYNIDSMEYIVGSGKEVRWSFIEGKEFTSVLFNAATLENQMRLAGDEIKQLIKDQWESVESIFERLPKLPAAGIVHAFVYDVIGMDQTISHILSDPKVFKGCGEMVCIKSLSKVHCDMSVGLYGKESNFTSGDVYAAYLGDGISNGRQQKVFEFRCSGASFDCQHGTSATQSQKQGYSYYDGIIAADAKTGIMSCARMTETIFSNQNQEKKKPASVLRRFVDMRASFE